MAKSSGSKIYFSLILAGVGLAGGLWFTFTLGNPPPPPSNQLTLPPSTPYDHAVSGTGLVEANSRNIAVGVFIPGIIDAVKINEGDRVAQGDILLTLDKRSAEADMRMREKEVANAQAGVHTAESALADEEDQLARAMALKSGVTVSENLQKRRQFAAQRAKAQLDQAKTNVESAKAALESAKVIFDKHTIRAPITGEVLKVRVRAGEFVNAGANGAAPIVIGDTEPLHLRVQIDENDLWRFDEKANAVAYLRSNKDRKYALSFVRIEPLVQPKRQLSGDTSEQVDTRIMEVLYAITPQADAPLFVGQQLDVFIEGKETASAEPKAP